jgi:hypothetical protein
LALIIRLGSLRRRVLMEEIFVIARYDSLPPIRRSSVCTTADAA